MRRSLMLTKKHKSTNRKSDRAGCPNHKVGATFNGESLTDLLKHDNKLGLRRDYSACGFSREVHPPFCVTTALRHAQLKVKTFKGL